MSMRRNQNSLVWLLGLFALATGCSDCGKGPEPVASEIRFVGDRTSLENAFNANFKFEVRLDAPNDQEVLVDYETVEGTAKAGEDFEPVAGTLVFEPGDLIQDILVPIIIDEGLESDEQFTVVLSNPVNGYLLGNVQVATGTILNDDTSLEVVLPEGGYDTPHGPDNPPPGMSLVWSDEFDGSAINPANWVHETGGNGWGNNEWQVYTDDEANSYVEDGHLMIVALQEGGTYTSARLKSQDLQEFQFGRIDIRAVLPFGQGVWPALWMLGANFNEVGWPECGEIDIMELLGHQPNFVHGTAHWGEIIGGGHPSYGVSTYSDFPTTFVDEFHVFSIEWSQDTIQWLMNDEVFHTITSENVAPYESPFNAPFFFIMNIAVGGNWPGYPDESTLFPQFMAVDYIRVYQ
jgi:beta-glucanase (GH16 family)